MACRNIGLLNASSARALIGAIFGFADFSQKGTNPHLFWAVSIFPSLDLATMGWNWEGATLYRGKMGPESIPNRSLMAEETAAGFLRWYRPHIRGKEPGGTFCQTVG
jgi:hypothetical protein